MHLKKKKYLRISKSTTKKHRCRGQCGNQASPVKEQSFYRRMFKDPVLLKIWELYIYGYGQMRQ